MKPSITVVSLGPGDPSLLTLRAADALRHARRLILRTERHRAVPWLAEQQITFESLDGYYDRYDDFDEMHRAMAAYLWQEAAKAPVTYAVIDATCDESVIALRGMLPEEGKLDVIPGVSAADRCLSALPAGVTHTGRVRILPAIDAVNAPHDPTVPLLITELWNPALAGDVKLWLTDLYDDETEIVLFPSTAQVSRKPARIPLMDLDRQKTYDHTVCAYIPASGLDQRQRFCLDDLVRIMRRLRGPEGCPWDRQQTHQTLKKYLIEEAYEAIGAIDEGDPDHLADELGDVLLQIVFHADIAQAHGDFTISDVTSAICRKMIYRHAHIFGADRCETAEEVSVNWEALKKAEKGLATQSEVLADVSKSLPALMRAEKVQKKAAQVGFDWQSLADIRSWAESLPDAPDSLGEMLFLCVAAARLSGVEPESALREATETFIRRFESMENAIISDGKALKDLTLREMVVYWKKAGGISYFDPEA